MKTAFRDHVAAYFRAHPNVWVNADALMLVGGRYAFRTRVSEARLAYRMNITNRVRRGANGVAISEYRYTPALVQPSLFSQEVA